MSAYLSLTNIGNPRTVNGIPPWRANFPKPVAIYTPLQHNLVTGEPYTQVVSASTQTLENFDRGPAMRCRGGDGWVLPLTSLPYFEPPATVLAIWRPLSTGQNGTFFSFGGSGAGNGWRCGMSTTQYRVTWGGVADYDSGVSYTLERTVVVAFALGGNGSNYDLVENGAHRATTSTGGTIVTSTLRGAMTASNESGGSQYYTNLIVAWNQRLPIGMLMRMTADPRLFLDHPVVYRATAAAFLSAWVRTNTVTSSGARVA